MDIMGAEQGPRDIDEVKWQQEQDHIPDRFYSGYTQLKSRQSKYNASSDPLAKALLDTLIRRDQEAIKRSLLMAPKDSTWLAVYYDRADYMQEELVKYCVVDPAEAEGIFIISMAKLSDFELRNYGGSFKDFNLYFMAANETFFSQESLFNTKDESEITLKISEANCELFTDYELKNLLS